MRLYLYFYYQKKGRIMIIMTIINVWYFMSNSMLNMFDVIHKTDGGKMTGFLDHKPYEDTLRIVNLIMLCLIFIPIFLYVYINAKHIEYKQWMIDVLYGYRLL